MNTPLDDTAPTADQLRFAAEQARHEAAFSRLGSRSLKAADVPAFVRAGCTVWSYGYGDDLDGFTTIEESDLWLFDEDLAAAEATWGPFRLD